MKKVKKYLLLFVIKKGDIFSDILDKNSKDVVVIFTEVWSKNCKTFSKDMRST